MVHLKYFQSVLRSELGHCRGNIKKSLFLSKEDIAFLEDKHCLVSIQPDVNGKCLAVFDRAHLLALCS